MDYKCDRTGRQEVAACLTLLLYLPSKILVICVTPICAWMLVTYRLSPLHLNTSHQHSNPFLRVDASYLLLGSGNLQDNFSLRLDSKIGPSFSKECYSLTQFFLLFLGAFAKFAKSDC
jgi:hypothetical protein